MNNISIIKKILNYAIIIIIVIFLFISLILFVIFLPMYMLLVLGIAIAIALYFLMAVMIQSNSNKSQHPKFWERFATLSIIFLVLPFIFGVFLFYYDILSLFLIIFMTGLTFTFFYNFLSIPLAIYHKFQESKSYASSEYAPFVSIIVPAYNEEKCIGRTIETIIESDYPNREIIVVDDGSTDRTYEIARSYYNQGVTILHRPNGGKYAALNYGLLFAKGEIIINIDADSLIAINSIKKVIERFYDPKIGAVAGNIKVLNRNSFLTRCQALDYINGINLLKRAYGVMGVVTVIPGAFGAYRRKILKDCGFYDPDTLVEDFDVTIKILKSSIISQSTSGIAYTEAPETMKDLIKQRLRWYKGNFQTLIKHYNILLNPRFGFLYKLIAPFMLISTIFLPFINVVISVSAIMLILTGNVIGFLYTITFFIIIQILIDALAIQLDEEDMTLLLYSPLFVIGYNHLISFIIIASFFATIFKREVTWAKITRVGRVDTNLKNKK